jgi:hypothetical protein
LSYFMGVELGNNFSPKWEVSYEQGHRVAFAVTDLNGLISSIVNQEVTSSDFNHDLTTIFDKLSEVEVAISKLGDVFYRENLDNRVDSVGCVVKPDGTCGHGCN